MSSNDITDLTGTVWEYGSAGWYFWSGFGLCCLFYGFGIIKKLAQKTTGGTQDF